MTTHERRAARSRESLEREDELPVRRFDRRDRQSIAGTQQHQSLEFLAGMRSQFFERDGTRELAPQLHVHHEPARIAGLALGIVVVVLAIEGGGIGVASLHDLHDGDDARQRAAGMVEKRLVTPAHLIPQHVARLKIAHPVPRAGAARGGGEMLDAEGGGLGFHQPVAHRMIPSSVTTASMSTSWAAAVMCSSCWKP